MHYNKSTGMKKSKTLVIVGNIASGKSTATQIITQKLKAHKIDADDLFQTSDPFAKVYLENMSRWALTNELWLTVERVKLIKSEMEKNENSLVVIDSGLLMSWVYTYGHYLNGVISADEWNLFEDIYSKLCDEVLNKMLVVRLKYELPVLMYRLKNRGRQYELEFYTPEYLEQIEKGLVALEKKLQAERVPLLLIEQGDVQDFENSTTDRERLHSAVVGFI